MEKYGITNDLLFNKLNIEPNYKAYITGFSKKTETYEYDEEYFCEYLIKHDGYIDIISDVVNRLRDLGIDTISIDPKIARKYKKDSSSIYKMDDLDIYLTGDVLNTHVCGINAILKTLIVDVSKLPNKIRQENEVDDKDNDILSLRKKIDF